MKVNAINIARFWKRLMFPPDKAQYRYNRLVLKADIPWEPWLHAFVWAATILAIVIGERGIIPPIRGIDWYWISFCLVSPVIGFFSVWVLEYSDNPDHKYLARWGRMMADAGLAAGMFLYQLDRMIEHGTEDVGFGHGVLPNAVFLGSIGFALTLVKRDIEFLADTEVLAEALYSTGR